MNADGTQQVQLTSLGHNGYPSWTTDNQQMLFASNRDGEWRVYSMNPDGSNQRPLIEKGSCTAPQLSMAGQLSYTCLQDGNWEIYVEDRRITNNDTDDRLHVWSPLGDLIAFEALKNDGQHRVLFVVNPDGSGLRPLTGAEYRSWNVAWSPDGRRLVFASDREGNARLFVIGVDGSALQALTRADQWSQAPAWSPNGRWISYVAGDGPVWTLYRIESDGQNRLQLARYAHPGQTQSWAPDSQRLAFASNADGDYEIYVVKSDGSGLKQLTRNRSDDHSPAWSR